MGTKGRSILVLAVLAALGTGYHFLNSRNEHLSELEFESGATAAEISGEVRKKLELPCDPDDCPAEVIEHMGYTVSYNSRDRIPNWVAYELQASELYRGNREGMQSFAPDPTVKGRQAYDLEMQVRYECKYYGTIWEGCRPILDRNRFGTIGFIFPDEPGRKPLRSYSMTVDELEERIGMDLFCNLDNQEQEKAEAVTDPCEDWRIR